MALDRRHMLMCPGIGRYTATSLRIAAGQLDFCSPARVAQFNLAHGEATTGDPEVIHGELALRMYPYLREAHAKTARMLVIANSYLRSPPVLGSEFPEADSIRGLTELSEAARDVAARAEAVCRKDRTSEEHTVMAEAMDAAAASYKALARICGEALA